MIEDQEAADRESNVVFEIKEADSSSNCKEISDSCAYGSGTSSPPLPQSNGNSHLRECVGDGFNSIQCDESNLSEDGVTSNAQLVDQTVKPALPSAGSNPCSDRKRGAPSPLLFTPVKGEDLYGASYLTQNGNFKVTPTHAVDNGSTSKIAAPVFCMPSPMLKKTDLVIKHEGSVPHVSAGMKRSSQHSVGQPLDSHINTSVSNEQNSDCRVPLSCNRMPGKKLENHFESPSPSKCFRWGINETAAQIDSSPSPSKSSESSFFITPKKVEETKPMPEPTKLVCPRVVFRTKGKNRLRTLVSRARHSLSGIPPPPAFTMPQISVHEILSMLKRTENNSISITCDVAAPDAQVQTTQNLSNSNGTSSFSSSTSLISDEQSGTSTVVNLENECQFGTASTSQLKMTDSYPSKDCATKSLFCPTGTEKEIMEMPWPAVLNSVHLGICYNLGSSSEALEELCQQVRERYVGNETASSCTVWSLPCATKGPSPRKGRNGKLLSNVPAQESYMKRRKRAFSLASLASTMPSLSTKSRQILVNKVTKKSVEATNNQRSGRSDDKGMYPEKEDPKISLIKKCLGENEKNTSKLKSMRRSMSFSGNTASSGQSSSSSSVIETSSPCVPSTMLQSTKRVLKFDRLPRAASSPILDARSVQSKTSGRVSIPRDSCEGVEARVNSSPDLQRPGSSCSGKSVARDLSEVHKKKLLWAVAEALRSRGLGTGHQKFKVCAIPLYRCCRDAYLALPVRGTDSCVMKGNGNNAADAISGDMKSVGSTDSQKERTSDKMLNIAMGLVDKIMGEVGVEAVMKDRTVMT